MSIYNLRAKEVAKRAAKLSKLPKLSTIKKLHKLLNGGKR